jgi:hypothetical protein
MPIPTASHVNTLAASTAIPVPAATPAGAARLAPGSPWANWYPPANNDGNETPRLGRSPREKVLAGGKAGVEGCPLGVSREGANRRRETIQRVELVLGRKATRFRSEALTVNGTHEHLE